MTLVQELCRKLKPVMGRKIDRLWTAYLAESDAAGSKPEGGYIDDVVVRQFVNLEETASRPPATTQSMPAGDRPSSFNLVP